MDDSCMDELWMDEQMAGGIDGWIKGCVDEWMSDDGGIDKHLIDFHMNFDCGCSSDTIMMLQLPEVG